MSRSIKLTTLILTCLLIAQATACNPGKTKDEITAQETLQAINTEETLSASSSTGGKPESSSQPVRKPKRPPVNIPNDPPEPERTLADSDSSLRAEDHRVLSGDNFLKNLYERPFTSQDMIYQPDLDIYTVDFTYDDDYFYFTINLNGTNNETGELSGMYGIEFDRTLTGKGDLIVVTQNPSEKWEIKKVRAFIDVDGDVGGPHPMIADEGFSGNGYDKRVEMIKDNNLAFARISPSDSEAIQIAVSHTLLDYSEKFLWGAWTNKERMKLNEFDYNDTMGPSEAGSPFIDNEDYPIKALYNFDNTCRLPYGFEQIGNSYPGMCISLEPTPVPETTCTNVCLDWCTQGDTTWCCGGWQCK